MATSVAKADEILEVWKQYKPDCTDKDLRNRLMERYFHLVKYNGERIWQRLPDGVELDDLISAGVFGLMDAIEIFLQLSCRLCRGDAILNFGRVLASSAIAVCKHIFACGTLRRERLVP